MTLFEFLKSFTYTETKVGLFQGANSGDFVILACVVLIELQSVTDIRIDRQTPLP